MARGLTAEGISPQDELSLLWQDAHEEATAALAGLDASEEDQLSFAAAEGLLLKLRNLALAFQEKLAAVMDTRDATRHQVSAMDGCPEAVDGDPMSPRERWRVEVGKITAQHAAERGRMEKELLLCQADVRHMSAVVQAHQDQLQEAYRQVEAHKEQASLAGLGPSELETRITALCEELNEVPTQDPGPAPNRMYPDICPG